MEGMRPYKRRVPGEEPARAPRAESDKPRRGRPPGSKNKPVNEVRGQRLARSSLRRGRPRKVSETVAESAESAESTASDQLAGAADLPRTSDESLASFLAARERSARESAVAIAFGALCGVPQLQGVPSENIAHRAVELGFALERILSAALEKESRAATRLPEPAIHAPAPQAPAPHVPETRATVSRAPEMQPTPKSTAREGLPSSWSAIETHPELDTDGEDPEIAAAEGEEGGEEGGSAVESRGR